VSTSEPMMVFAIFANIVVFLFVKSRHCRRYQSFP